MKTFTNLISKSSTFCVAPLMASKCLIINSWRHFMKGGKEFRVVRIREGGEGAADVTRIIRKLKGDSTVCITDLLTHSITEFLVSASNKLNLL